MANIFGLPEEPKGATLKSIGVIHPAPEGMMAVYRTNDNDVLMMPVMSFAACVFDVDGEELHTIRPQTIDLISGEVMDVDMVESGDLVCLTPPGADPEDFIKQLLGKAEKPEESKD